MRNFYLIALLLIIFSYLNLGAEDSFVGYAEKKISVKFTRSALAQIDLSKIKDGLTGIDGFDSISSQYNVARIEKHFPHFKIKSHNDRPVTLDAWFKVHFENEVDVQSVAAEYDALMETITAEPIAIHRIYDSLTPNDPDFGQQWHLNQTNDADVDAPEAWFIGTGSSNVIVAMMDSGVRWYHKDLAGNNASESDRNSIRGNIWINTDELTNTSSTVDEDGNGYNDDWVGWDFVTGNPQLFDVGDDYDVEDNDPRDFNGHGTHCGGNIGAINNNSLGVSAVTGGWGEDGSGNGNGVKVMCLRIGWDDALGGYVNMDFAANAFLYAANNGAFAASCSWGSSSNTALQDAIEYFVYNTTEPDTANDPRYRLIFKAAGNDQSTTPDFMESRTDVITVAGTNESDSEYSSTAYGDYVNISAPATNIYSTYHNSGSPGTDDYASLTGTSMATPIAASVAALIKSQNPSLTAPQVEQMLYDTADDIEANLSSSHQGKMGAGRVNAYNAVYQSDLSLPVELSALSAHGEKNRVVLQWSTESEIDNAGFIIKRAMAGNGNYEEISSYKKNPDLRGQGTVSYRSDYQFVDNMVIAENTYWYKLVDIDINGRRQEHGPVSAKPLADGALARADFTVPEQFALHQNYPNPFNPVTNIVIDIPDYAGKIVDIDVLIYDISGRKIMNLYQGAVIPGRYQITWDGKNNMREQLPSGMYIYAVFSKSFGQAKRMILLR